MKICIPIGLTCAALTLSGCAAIGVHPVSVATTRTIPDTPQQALTYHVFVGELAWQRGESQIAVLQYAQAAELSSDPSLVEHAAMMAYQLDDNLRALEMAQLWGSLAPKNSNVRQLEAVLDTRLGRIDAAVYDIETLLRDMPGYSLMLAGELLSKEAGAQPSLPVMQKLVAAHTQSAEAHFALARLALQAGDTELAVSESQRAAALKPDWNPALVLEARALVAAGHQDEAVQLLQARTRAAPGSADLQLAYGALLAELGRNSQAQMVFAKVLKQSPRNPDALYSLGLLALQANHLDEARAYFLQLLHTAQRNNQAFYFLGNTAELSNQYDDALQWYQQVDGGQYWLPAQIDTARVLTAQGKVDAMRGFLDGLVNADPDDGLQFRLAEAQLFTDTHDAKTAMDVYAQALAEYQDNAELLYARALLSESLGQVSAAENDLRRVLDQQPDNAAALNALGYTLAVHTTRYQEARVYIRKALQLKPDDPAIIDSMGWVEYQLGDYAQALGYLRKAYAQLADPEVAAHLSQALWATGDRQGARSVWSAALKQHPGNAALIKLNTQFSQ